MRRILICLFALAFVAGVAQAAEISTKAGSKALVFQFSGLSDLGLSNYAGGIGARWYMSDGTALRPGIDLTVSSDKTKGVGGSSDAKGSELGAGLSLALEKHMQGPKSISPYLGVGAGFGYSRHTTEPSLPPSPPVGAPLKTTAKRSSADVYGLCGFEWGFTESLTLGGEYRFGLAYNKQSTEQERQGMPTVKGGDRTQVELGINTASVFLSVAL